MGRCAAVAAATTAILFGLASTASAAFTMNPTRTFPIGTFQYGGYAPGFDGTFWTVSTGSSSGGAVGHVDDEGHDLGDGFEISNAAALGIAYYGGRVFIPVASDYSRIVSYNVANGGDPLSADSETSNRMGSVQAILRSYPGGLGTLALGQAAKVATLDLAKSVGTHPWYPQAFHGNGVNDPVYKVEGNSFESCVLDGEGVVIGEPSAYCGNGGYIDTGNGTHPGFNYAIDTAPGLGGLYVADLNANRVTHINTTANPGATIDFTFGQGPGSAAGQLDRPWSIVVQPGTNYVFVSEEGNRRISVFDAGGHYIASFGYGVRDGSDVMQVCGVEIGNCRAGVPSASDSRSLFTRLDFGPEGELFAYMPLTGQIQVFSVGGGPGGAGGAGGPPAGGTGPAAGVQRVRLSAHPLRVRKGRKTTLTAIVNFGKDCANRKVLFQVRAGRGWDNFGKAAKTGKGCTASKRVKVTVKSVYRAVLIDSSNQQTLGYSPKVTVKLK